MGNDDKLKNTANEKKGQAKETAGKTLGNEQMEAEGKNEKSKASAKQAGEKVKDAFKG